MVNAEKEPTPIHATEYVAAHVGLQAFHCPFCRVYAQQEWRTPHVNNGPFQGATAIRRSTCRNCRKHTYWLAPDDGRPEETCSKLLEPLESVIAPAAHVDMPPDPRADYEEARGIVERSPRGAVALLRLALQKLMMSLGQPGKDINDDIAALVKEGLPVKVQMALDSLRVTGNEAVHPGVLDLTDDTDRASALFGLMNYIVEQQITQPRELEAIYKGLPPSKLEGIEQRDGKPTGST